MVYIRERQAGERGKEGGGEGSENGCVNGPIKQVCGEERKRGKWEEI